LKCNGWEIRATEAFAAEMTRLRDKVEAAYKKNPVTANEHPIVKFFAAVTRLTTQVVPSDPGAAEFRQGNTLGNENRHWFRAKLQGRYRLFYRYSTAHKVIIYAWLNDESSLRKVGSKSDPYAKFAAMLASGDPPSDFDELLSRSYEI